MSEVEILFPEPDPADSFTGPIGYADPALRWYRNSIDPYAIKWRLLINRWFRDSAVRNNPSFRKDVLSERTFKASLNELFVDHNISRSVSFLRCEDGPSRPDLIFGIGSSCHGVEVKTFTESDSPSPFGTYPSRLIDGINQRMTVVRHTVSLAEIIELEKEPKIADVVHFLSQAISNCANLESTIATRPKPVTFRQRKPSVVIRFNIWTLPEGYNPKDGERIADSDMIIDLCAMDVDTLREAIRGKTRKKDLTGLDSFAVFLFLPQEAMGVSQVLSAMYGRFPFREQDWRKRLIQPLQTLSLPGRTRRLSAVFAAGNHWTPETEVKVYRFDNPFATENFRRE